MKSLQKFSQKKKLNNISIVYINYINVLYEATSVHRLSFVYLCVHIKNKKEAFSLPKVYLLFVYCKTEKKEKNEKKSEVKKNL